MVVNNKTTISSNDLTWTNGNDDGFGVVVVVVCVRFVDADEENKIMKMVEDVFRVELRCIDCCVG